MMQDTNARDDLKSFARLVDVLVPWLDQVVIVGGWAHRLYRLHPLAQLLEYESLATFDMDIAVPDNLPRHGEGIGARLAASGFTEVLLGETRPPAIHYRLVAGNAGFYAEFLTPLVGSENKRGKRDATASIAGVSAQKLRHIELLLSAPWQIEINPATGFPTIDGYLVQIPNPAAYLVQKILIHERREFGNRAKDLLYIHDTIEVFGSALPELKKVWHESVRPLLSAKAVRSVEAAPKVLFGEVSDTIREAARMAIGRVVSPAQLLETCEAGLSAILA
jgi:hypothetical protein